MEKHIGPSFKKAKALIYKKDSNGFYVYAKPNLCDTQTVVKYISRYLGRPVIALSRIDSYDGENVTFHYNRQEVFPIIQKSVPLYLSIWWHTSTIIKPTYTAYIEALLYESSACMNEYISYTAHSIQSFHAHSGNMPSTFSPYPS